MKNCVFSHRFMKYFNLDILSILFFAFTWIDYGMAE